MKYIRVLINGFLALWFADRVGCGDMNPWFGTFVALVFLSALFREASEA